MKASLKGLLVILVVIGAASVLFSQAAAQVAGNAEMTAPVAEEELVNQIVNAVVPAMNAEVPAVQQ